MRSPNAAITEAMQHPRAHRRASRQLPAGAAGDGPAGGLQDLPVRLEDGLLRPLRRARAIGGRAADLRARSRPSTSFLPEEYWSIIGEFRTAGSEPFLAKLFKVDGERSGHRGRHDGRRIRRRTSASSSLSIADIQKKPVQRNPPPPFITSTLQQEAARRLRFHAKRTMMLAQKLYEGIELGEEGRVGLITYMRTDSTRLSEDAVREVRRVHLRELRQGVPAARGAALQEGEGLAGRPRGDPADLDEARTEERSRSTWTRRCSPCTS